MKVAAFMVSDAASYLTAAAVTVDSGLVRTVYWLRACAQAFLDEKIELRAATDRVSARQSQPRGVFLHQRAGLRLRQCRRVQADTSAAHRCIRA